MGNTPIWFKCPQERREDNDNYFRRRHHGVAMPPRQHYVHRTGRTKPNPSRKRSPRSLGERHEWECSCGRTGWTIHSDILRRPLEES